MRPLSVKIRLVGMASVLSRHDVIYGSFGAGKTHFGGLGKWWGVLAGALLIAAWINSTAGPAGGGRTVCCRTHLVLLSGTRDLWRTRSREGRRLPQQRRWLALGCHIRSTAGRS